MANDLSLYFHGTSASGVSTVDTTAINGPSVNLGSNSVNRAIMAEMRIASVTPSGATGLLDVRFQDSTDGTTYANMPGTTAAIIGFARATTSSYSSTDAVAPNAPARILIRTDKQFVRAVITGSATTTSFNGVTIVGKLLSGANSGAMGPRDT